MMGSVLKIRLAELQRPDGDMETTLVGRLADQAARKGVLNTLYELHLPVLSAQYMEEETKVDELTERLVAMEAVQKELMTWSVTARKQPR
jgi:glutamate/tyrosine decarboxylase-like PLP-dependent enzyme